MDSLGIQWPKLIAQFVNFSIVLFVLWRFAYKPVFTLLEARRQKIADSITNADKIKAQLDAVQLETAETLKKAQVQATDIIEQARKASKEIAEREAAVATERATDLITKARQAIDLEKQKMLAEARAEIARLVIATTQRVLAKELNDADRGRYNEAAVRELTTA